MLVNCGLFSLLACGFLTVLAWSVAPRSDDAEVAVVFPPWTSSATAIERATATGSALVQLGRLPFIVVVHPASNGGLLSPARFGAWLLIDASKLPLCSSVGGRRA